MNGDGTGNDLSGVLRASSIGSAIFAEMDCGKNDTFTVAENTVEDADSDPATSAWLLGSDLNDSARGTLIEPGSDRRTSERGRISLSGYRAHRSDSALPATTGVFADWASVVLVMQDPIVVVVDTVTRPGDVRVTTPSSRAPAGCTRSSRLRPANFQVIHGSVDPAPKVEVGLGVSWLGTVGTPRQGKAVLGVAW